jgi:hypothetical protein
VGSQLCSRTGGLLKGGIVEPDKAGFCFGGFEVLGIRGSTTPRHGPY